MSEVVYFSGDEILVIDGHGITPFTILRVVKREFKLLTKYYYELQYSNGETRWISSIDLNNKTVVRITPENTCGARNPPEKNLPEKKVIKIEDLDLNRLGSDISNALTEKVNDVKMSASKLTKDTECLIYPFPKSDIFYISTENYGSFVNFNSGTNILVSTKYTCRDLAYALDEDWNNIVDSCQNTTIGRFVNDDFYVLDK